MNAERRRELIEAGVLVPGCDVYVTPTPRLDTAPCLPLDDAGRRAARRAIERGTGDDRELFGERRR